MKHVMAVCAGIVLLSSYTYMHAHDSYLTRSLEHAAASPLFDQSEKELITKIPEFFTHAYVNQLYFGDTEQRALKPFIETKPPTAHVFNPIKEKISQLREQTATKEEQDMLNLVHYLITMLLECTNSAPTRASAADVAEACRELILINLEITKNINNNVNNIIGNISAPCT